MNLQGLLQSVLKGVYFHTSEDMCHVKSGTVQSVITSPPYWNLKDYGHPEQIGHGEDYERYHQRLEKVWSECYRVLNQSGTMWVVIDKITWKGDIVHIPFDIVKHCQKLNFFLKDIIIWNKPTAIAGMSKRNIVNKNEYILFFSKDKRHYKFNPPEESKIATPDFNKENGRLTDLWRFPVKAGSIRKTPNHKAPYPRELIKRIVQISTDVGDTVLDPFLGSGTTMKVALQLNRRCIGYEINRNFAPLIAERLKAIPP